MNVPVDMSLLHITPDRKITNNQARKFWRLMHELLELDHGWKGRIQRNGMTFTYQLRDTIWIEMVARCKQRMEKTEDGQERIEYDRTINFYLAVPTKFERTIRQKLLDRHPQITIELVDAATIAVPDAAEITEYRYARHDIFPLKINTERDQTSPISSIINVAYDMRGDDFFRFSVALERVSRQTWSRAAAFALKQLEQKRIPTRARVDVGLLIRQFTDTLRFVWDQVEALFTDLHDAVRNMFIKSEKIEKHGRKDRSQAEYERMLALGEWTDARKKGYDSTYKARVRLAVSADDRTRQHLIRSGISNAVSELNELNMLQPQKVRVGIRPKVIDEMNTFQFKAKDRDPNIMASKEIAKLNMYPTAELQERYADMLKSKRRVDVDIPKYFRDPKGIYIGTSEVHGEKIDIHVPMHDLDEFMMSRVFIGSPRMGKDTAIINFLAEAAKKGCGAVVLDVVNEQGNDRGMADSLRDALPPDMIIDLDASNTEWPFYIGLNEVMARSKDAGNRIANDFAAVFDVEDNGRTRHYLREAVKVCEGNPMDVRLLLLSDGQEGDFLHQKIAKLRQQAKHALAEFWRAYWDNGTTSRGMKTQIRQPILDRLDEIFGDDHLRNMFGQSVNPDIDFSKWLKAGKVILIRVPNNHPDLSELSVKVICQWIVLKTFYTKLMMADKECPSFLVLNEPHQFISDGMAKTVRRMLRECPKWRLSLIFAVHDFSSDAIPASMVDTLFSASMNWHIFKNTNDRVYDRLKHLLKPTYLPEEAMNQTPKHHSINAFFIDGEYQTPFLMQAPAPINKRVPPHDNKFLTLRHSKMFGRARQNVEKDIYEKEQMLFSPGKKAR